jgi:hypothetical protein
MPGCLTKQEPIAVAGVDDRIIRSLLDRQQFADPTGEAEQRGISSAPTLRFSQRRKPGIAGRCASRWRSVATPAAISRLTTVLLTTNTP